MTATGITTKQVKKDHAFRIEVESNKLKMVKNSHYRHPLSDPFYESMKVMGNNLKTI